MVESNETTKICLVMFITYVQVNIPSCFKKAFHPYFLTHSGRINESIVLVQPPPAAMTYNELKDAKKLNGRIKFKVVGSSLSGTAFTL